MSTDYFLNYIIMPLLSISILLVFIRFVKGPSISDRVISLDLIITIGIAMMAVYAISSGQEAFLDIATIFALIAFLGTVAFSYYLEKKERK
jgi:multicomponent Na+:H+ antiporter subunit F